MLRVVDAAAGQVAPVAVGLRADLQPQRLDAIADAARMPEGRSA